MADPGPLVDAAMGLAAAGLTVGGWTYAAMYPRSQLFGRVLVAGHNPGELALTFDDGPNGDTTLRLLDVLAKHEARATFFVIGRFVRKQPGIVQAIARAGHIVGNHTMTHPWLHIQTDARIREELRTANVAIEDTLGAPVRFFRPPHGARRPYVLDYARELSLTTVQWNIIANDWRPQESSRIVKTIQRGIIRNRRRNHSTNIVLHDGGDVALGQPRLPTVGAVDTLLASLSSQGIRPVTVDTWL
ncbi:polysaccharide deacetylase family protein [Granulicella sibirica]|uniref:Polysaccharide deacetylase family protein n=1 Tax=Granulicella sibirica TaxID=2479048 RepID=A0A4Q0T266_9BACT|nr:polysaccharide deacetylase family protein [Granulicella sibirica]RXH57693.1 Polysaccharide deacetylase family protein [Granulicella sibirica]